MVGSDLQGNIMKKKFSYSEHQHNWNQFLNSTLSSYYYSDRLFYLLEISLKRATENASKELVRVISTKKQKVFGELVFNELFQWPNQ